MIYTTLNELQAHNQCKDGRTTLLRSLNKTNIDDKPISFKYILVTLGLEDAIWCLRTQTYKDQCLFLADVVELEVWDNHPENARLAVEAIRKFHAGTITREELRYAADAADAAAYDVYVASNNASDADSHAAVSHAVAAAAAAAAASAADVYVAAAYSSAHDSDIAIKELFIKHFCGD